MVVSNMFLEMTMTQDTQECSGTGRLPAIEPIAKSWQESTFTSLSAEENLSHSSKVAIKQGQEIIKI